MEQFMRKTSDIIILVQGGGEVGSAVAHQLYCNHFRVCISEIARPLAVSRGTCFSEAVYDSKKTIEKVTAERTPPSLNQISQVWQAGNIPVVVDSELSIKPLITPDVIVIATMLKQKTTIKISDAPLVIGIGPGFFAGKDVHLVIESNNNDNLGKIIRKGKTEKNTGIPVEIGGLKQERVIWAPAPGIFSTERHIGDSIKNNEIVGKLDNIYLEAPLSGIIRGLLRSEVEVPVNAKLVEIDPINDRSICYSIRDRMRTIANGVLEAVLLGLNTGNS
jgi:xanthine dehydrogenase accessory factor